jgi:HK97 family phage major capsid protein
MSDQSEILKAIEASNRAFEEFKKVNDERLAKMEKGEGGADDLKAAMKKIFDDMAAQKAVIEAIEAKTKRPLLGGDGKPVNEDAEAHRKAFDGYIRKGADRELGALEAKALGWSTNSGADGGYAVPKVIDDAIAALAVNISPIRGLSRVQQVSTTDFHTLMNLRGTASGWVGETAARSATTSPTFADIKPTMGELYANLQATQQVLDDVFFNMESWVSEQIATEFSRAEGAAFVSGSGTNQPTGFLTGTPVATADGSRAFGVLQYTPTGVAADWAASNKADVFFTIAATLKQAYRQGAAWVMPKSILFEVMSFKDSGGRYVFNPQNAPGVEQNILGYPVVEAEDMPAKAANAFSVAFGNFKQGYIVVDRVGTRMIRDPFSNKPYIGFYVTKRVGGMVTNSEAIKLIKFAVS